MAGYGCEKSITWRLSIQVAHWRSHIVALGCGWRTHRSNGIVPRFGCVRLPFWIEGAIRIWKRILIGVPPSRVCLVITKRQFRDNWVVPRSVLVPGLRRWCERIRDNISLTARRLNDPARECSLHWNGILNAQPRIRDMDCFGIVAVSTGYEGGTSLIDRMRG